jgi:K+ transporter
VTPWTVVYLLNLGASSTEATQVFRITTLLATFVALHWKHNPFLVYAVNGSLLALDLLFFASASTQIRDGGLFPLLIALSSPSSCSPGARARRSWTRFA